jgi:RHS repeat-associated protein
VTEAFDYDDNGNLLETKLNNSSVTKFEYDIRNQLSKYTGVGNGINVTFDYDFERKRTSKTSANITTNYTYAGSQVINETNNNVISASYTIGGGEIVKSEFVANGESNYHFTDALGSVTSLTNNAGSLTSRSDYDAFGLQTGGSGSSNSIGYTGQRLDNETGLMALGNGERYYSPTYARFIQQDSVSGKSMSPQTMNRFSYANGNPNKYTDPSGHDGLVADKIKNDNLKNGSNTGYDNLDWWLNFGNSFVSGFTYDAANYGTLGAVGMVDVMAQDAVNGKVSNPMDAWNRGGYGASPVQIAKNFAYYGAGVVHGGYKVISSLPQIAVGLATHPLDTIGQVYDGIKTSAADGVYYAFNPRAALDELAQHSQEDIAFGVGETVGETIAGEGVGAVAGKVLGFAGEIIGKTKIGSAVGKVFTEAGSKVSNKFGAVRQGIRNFESKALGRISEKAGFKSFKGKLSNLEKYSEKIGVDDAFDSFDDYWNRKNYQTQLESRIEELGMKQHFSGDRKVVYAGDQTGKLGGVHPLEPNTIKIYKEGLFSADREFVETIMEEVHHSRTMVKVPETRLHSYNQTWIEKMEPRAKTFAKEYAERKFGKEN